MADKRMPGLGLSRRTAWATGGMAVVVVVGIVVAGMNMTTNRELPAQYTFRVTLHTEQIGDGIVAGSAVRTNGAEIGTVVETAPGDTGTQRIVLALDPAQLAGIDTGLRVDYTPAGVYGASEIELFAGDEGRPLHHDSVVELTGARAGDVYDATQDRQLRDLSGLGTALITPKVGALIARVDRDLQLMAPLLRALARVARELADNQTMSVSELMGRLGPALDGGGRLAAALVRSTTLLDNIHRLAENRDRFDDGVQLLSDRALPGLAEFGQVAGARLSGIEQVLSSLLSVLRQLVPEPERNGADVAELLRRLATAMPDSGSGPVLGTELEFGGGQR
ncbi:mammalian cell entry protein [Nocardia sp. NPDC056064]|uniref:mammalian cell entry protein n=1 Tax=Nocardia sp. NPDC056064 TaxID=3345701 RepID=UPI0035D7D5DC